MLFQLCTYQTSQDENKLFGLAKMVTGFNCYDVAYIIDLDIGNKVPSDNLWNYDLLESPLAYIDTNYNKTVEKKEGK
jgi:hypothetical protein